MSEIYYRPLIEAMTWSYSRIKSFEDCPYRWYLHYLRGFSGSDLFFSSYGSFMHKLLERYYSGEASADVIQTDYLLGFRDEVTLPAPSDKVFRNYFRDGFQYLSDIKPLPFRPVAVEQRLQFTVNGVRFNGILDLLCECEDGLVIVDHKSRALKPRSGRAKPLKSDLELDSYLIQLYLYAEAVRQEYGELPKMLCFNCFRVPVFIKEPFRPEAFEQAKSWLVEKTEEIANEENFNPNLDYFKCKYLCEMQEHCEYYELFGR